jgi:hypothetical protein
MADKTGISWTDATCYSCSETKPLDLFGKDASRANGRCSICRSCKNARARTGYVKHPAPSRMGAFLVPTRDGDKKQARHRVNHRVDVGLIPDPNDLACMDCGDEQGFDSARHEYDHAKGYDRENQLYVEPVCTVCHHNREEARCG